MGNTMEQAGFGDTRLSDHGDEDCEETTDLPDLIASNINPGDYTYRDGVNYKKNENKENKESE